MSARDIDVSDLKALAAIKLGHLATVRLSCSPFGGFVVNVGRRQRYKNVPPHVRVWALRSDDAIHAATAALETMPADTSRADAVDVMKRTGSPGPRFCACGRRTTECDGSRTACASSTGGTP